MNQESILSNSFIKMLAIGLVFILGIGYIIFSYNYTYKTALNQNKAFLSVEEKEISEAFNQYNQYLNLIELRLSHSLHSEGTITRILGERVETLMAMTFPRVINLEFIPTSNVSIVYTRLGVTSTDSNAKISHTKEGITYLGKGVFKVIKYLHDEEKKTFGTLKITFSISHLLYKHFTESEIHIFPEDGKAIRRSLLTFKITSLPYVFAIDRPPPTFWQFLLSAKVQILYVVTLMIAVIFIGIAVGSFLNKKILLKQRDLNKKLKEKLKATEKKNAKISDQLVSCESLLQYKEHSTKLKNELFIAVNERYRQMAAQAQSINLLTSELILEEAGNDKLLKKIHSISQEGTTVLRQLVDGFLMKEKVEEIDVLKSLEKIKELFLPELVEKNIQFSIKGSIKKPLQADLVTFEIVLHNVFNVIIDRLLKNNVFQVEIKDQDPFQIIFYDNGYDLEEKVDKVKSIPKPDNILWLDKVRLKEFITHLGWEISFLKGKQLLNSIKLSIPRDFKEKDLPDNVINLFDHKPYAQ